MGWSFLDLTGLSHFFGKLPEKLMTTDTTQTISGTKSFSSTILGSVSGSAAEFGTDIGAFYLNASGVLRGTNKATLSLGSMGLNGTVAADRGGVITFKGDGDDPSLISVQGNMTLDGEGTKGVFEENSYVKFMRLGEKEKAVDLIWQEIGRAHV